MCEECFTEGERKTLKKAKIKIWQLVDYVKDKAKEAKKDFIEEMERRVREDE